MTPERAAGELPVLVARAERKLRLLADLHAIWRSEEEQIPTAVLLERLGGA
jgi:hypothetical protein